MTNSNLLSREREILESTLTNCLLCPRECGVNRLAGELGVCRVGSIIKIGSATLHQGEEPPISGNCGSGTIFFSCCNAKCIYCQNYPLSQLGYGTDYSLDRFTEVLLNLQNKGAHNINLVTPVPYSPMIKIVLVRAREQGLKIPILMNLFGWENSYFYNLVKDFVNVFLVDIRYGDNELGEKYSRVDHYIEVNRNFLEMILNDHPEPKFSDTGLIQSGLIIRHLVLPNHVDNSIKVLNNINECFGTDVYVSLMNQYFPAYQALENNLLNRNISKDEWNLVMEHFKKLGFQNGWIQEFNDED